jgi:site-specific recombinase XerD
LLKLWLVEFYAHLDATGRKAHTIHCYKARLEPVASCLGDRDPRLITITDLETCLSSYRGQWGQASQITLATYIQATKTFFQFCTNRGYYQVSPAANLKRPSRAGEGLSIRPGDMILSGPTTASDPTGSDDDSLPGRIGEFLTYLRANGRRPATLEMYDEGLRPLANRFVGMAIRDITPRMIDQWVVSLGGHYAAATVSMFVRQTKYFFRFCVTRGYLESTPAGHLKALKAGRVSSDKIIRQPDLDAMIGYAKQQGLIREFCWLMFLADTGARTGEMQSIDLVDLDLVRCEATVRGKTGERILDYTPATGQALAAWLTIRPATDPQALFTTRRGRVSHAAIYHRLGDIAGALGITRFNPHSIRHRVGQAWTDQGASLELVRLKLGHADVTTTARFYTHQDHERVKAASARYSLVK